MFAVEIPGIYFYARFSKARKFVSPHTTEQTGAGSSPQERILKALAAMLPSTTEEIAEAAGLELAGTAACLDELAMRYRVMFNPLTKRFSLPKVGPGAALAA